MKLVPDLNGTRRIPVKPVNKASLQATSKFDAVQEAERMERKLGRSQWASSRNFLGGGATADPEYLGGISKGTPFLDMYKNPLYQRGEPGAAEKLKREGKKPFTTTVGGNKSSVLPNGIFDVIREAQLEGGVTNRAMVREIRTKQFMSKTSPTTLTDGGDSLIIPETSD